METINAILRELTFDDLDQWAGEPIRVKGKSYIKRVEGLCRTPEKELVAWVSGSEEYATLVHLDQDGYHGWFCTCLSQGGGPCKHAVAVVLAAAEQVKHKKDIPLLDQDDDLNLNLFGGQVEAIAPREQQDRDGSDGSGDDPGSPPGRKKKAGKGSLHKLLAGKSREELLELVVGLAGRYPEVERNLLEAEQLHSGRIDPLVRGLRQEIKTLSSEPAWYNHWQHEGNIPDYSHVREQFQALLGKGHADAVLQLGEELRLKGTAQVEQSDDEGETGRAIADCLEVVLQAVPKSSLTPPQQLMWVIDRMLEDEFSLLESGEAVLKNPVYTKEHWQEAASVLENRLETDERLRSCSFSDTYQRKEVMNRLIKAYQMSGWEEKILPLLEREADMCKNYEQLVDALLAAGNRELARQWCIRGFIKTRDNIRGIAAGLLKKLREIAAAEKRFDLVAAYRAQEFFNRAALETYKELRKAAEKVGNWPIVRAGALRYLETGHRPDLPGKGGKITDWPLPEPEVRWLEVKERRSHQPFPDRAALIDIAILEKRFDDVVEHYRTLQEKGRVGGHIEQTVAKAVSKSHPEMALGIWLGIAEGLIAQVKPAAYVEAGGYLRLMRKVYEADNRQGDWQALLAELRQKHKAKRKLLEVLDSLANTGKKIVE